MRVKNAGFTLVEVILVLALLAIVGTATGTYISDSFRDNNRLDEKVEIQNSVTALMNKIETSIKEADIPVLVGNAHTYENKFIINGMNEDKEFELINNKVEVSDGNIYENIERVTVTKKTERGAEIEVVGLGNKYSLKATYYSQNLNVNKIPYTTIRVFSDGTQIEEQRSGMIGEEVRLNIDGNSISESGKITFLGGRYTEDGDIWHDFECDTDKAIELYEGIELKIEYEYSRTKKVIKLDEDGDGNIDNEVELEYGTEYILPTPTRICHIFNGWYDGDKRITSNMIITSIEPITLVARWTVRHEGTAYYSKTSTQHIKICSSCNYEFSRENHNFDVVNSTCTTNGSKKCRLSECGYTVILEKVAHNYSNQDGKCTVCGAQQFIECDCCEGNSWLCDCYGWCSVCDTCDYCCRCSSEPVQTVTPTQTVTPNQTVTSTPSYGGNGTIVTPTPPLPACNYDSCERYLTSGGSGFTSICSLCQTEYAVNDYRCTECGTNMGFFVISPCSCGECD